MLVLIGLSGLVYATTIAPSLNWGDGARLQMEAVLGSASYRYLGPLDHMDSALGILDRLGCTPWDHPLYLTIGHAVASLTDDPLVGLNLLSSVFSVCSLCFLFRAASRLTGCASSAAAACLILAFSHTFWFHSVTTEVYSLHVLFMSWTIDWVLSNSRSSVGRSVKFAAATGAGLANHVMFSLTLVPSLSAASCRRQLSYSSRGLGLAALMFVVGLAPWWIAFLHVANDVGLGLALESTFWGRGLIHLYADQTVGQWLWNPIEYLLLLTYQFTPIGVAIGMFGWWRMRREVPETARYLTSLYVCHVLFSANFPVADRFAFHLPSYAVFTLGIAYGMHDLCTRNQPALAGSMRRGLILVPLLSLQVIIYACSPAVARAWGFDERRVGISRVANGFRDGMAYYLTPWKNGDDSALRFARFVLGSAAQNALILAPHPDVEAYLVLRYVQLVEGKRSDLEIDPVALVPRDEVADRILQRALQALESRPVYLGSRASTYPTAELRRHFDFVQEAGLVRLVPRGGGKRPRYSAPAPPSGEKLETILRRALK